MKHKTKLRMMSLVCIILVVTSCGNSDFSSKNEENPSPKTAFASDNEPTVNVIIDDVIEPSEDGFTYRQAACVIEGEERLGILCQKGPQKSCSAEKPCTPVQAIGPNLAGDMLVDVYPAFGVYDPIAWPTTFQWHHDNDPNFQQFMFEAGWSPDPALWIVP